LPFGHQTSALQRSGNDNAPDAAQNKTYGDFDSWGKVSNQVRTTDKPLPLEKMISTLNIYGLSPKELEVRC
jgi:hypothetical protein